MYMLYSLVVSEFNLIAYELVLRLYEGGCVVLVKSEKPLTWEKYLGSYLSTGKILLSKDIPSNTFINYLFVFGNKREIEKLKINTSSKIALIISLYEENLEVLEKLKSKSLFPVVFEVGESFGEGDNEFREFPANVIFREITQSARFTKYENNSEFFIAQSKDAADFILKNTFSLSHDDDIKFFGKRINSEIFSLVLSRHYGYKTDNPQIIKQNVIHKHLLPENIKEINENDLLEEFSKLKFYPPSRETSGVSSWMKAKNFSLRRDYAHNEAQGEDTTGVSPRELHIKKQEEKVEVKAFNDLLSLSDKVSQKKAVKSNGKKIFKFGYGTKFSILTSLAIFLFWFFVLPFLPLAVSGIGLQASLVLLNKELVKPAKKLAVVSNELSSYSLTRLQRHYTSYRFLRVFYESAVFDAYKIKTLSESNLIRLNLIEENFELFDFILGKKELDKKDLFNEINLNSDKLYRDLSHLGINGILKNSVLVERQFGMEASNLLGFNKESSYLILFQNNNVPRPSGGLIYGVGIAKFGNGKLKNISISSIDSLDKQLKGKVSPPKDFEIFSNKDFWLMRDSNWSSDFNIAAEVSEWFLEKEVGEKVDGVLAIDVNFIAELGQILGVNEVENFSQSEGLLLDWTKNVVESLTKTPENLYLRISKATLKALKEKHISVYMNSLSMRKSINLAGFGGSIPIRNCDCDYNMMGVIESWDNLTLKEEVKRTQSLLTEIKKDEVVNTLNYWIDYRGDGKKGRVQFRLITPKVSELVKVVIKQDGVSSEVESNSVVYENRFETSVIADIGGGSNLLVTFSWKQPRSSEQDSSEYTLFIRKQPGLEPMPVAAKTVINKSSLTKPQDFFYNTDLREDFVLSIKY